MVASKIKRLLVMRRMARRRPLTGGVLQPLRHTIM
jgi:hypothetical protein